MSEKFDKEKILKRNRPLIEATLGQSIEGLSFEEVNALFVEKGVSFVIVPKEEDIL